ncbi:MAG: RecQ family ATP-dependent DNA helicase [Flavobacteriaceae bacterium]
MTPLKLLQHYWKHDSFRNSQEAIINTVLNQQEVIALLPTGGGKSVCYQIPALMNEGICIVVSPLIALMHDQVNSLIKKGIKAIAITSKLTETELVIAFDNMLYGGIKFLYISPEKLQSEFIKQKIKQLNVNLIAIDEAHCISEWGHDFRPSYLQINTLRELQPNVKFIALTATATPKVIADIEFYLELQKPTLYKDSFYRPNLAYQVFKTEDILFKLKQILTKTKEPSIIYVSTRKQTKDISDFLTTNKFKSSYYHGGLSVEEKELAFKNWMTQKTNTMVATNAFGMGIDKDNVKVVIHIDIPFSIENYIQEAGRAGRNGKKSFSVILYNNATLHDFEKRVSNNIISIETIKKIYALLNQHLQISKGELLEKNYKFNLHQFCSKYKLHVLSTYNSINILEKEGVLVLEDNFRRKNTIRFLCSNRMILQYIENHPRSKKLIRLILRSYGGVFENRIQINENYLEQKLQQSKGAIFKQLKQFHTDKIVEYIHQSNDSNLRFLVMREDNITINRISKNIKKRNTVKQEKSNAIINFLTDNSVCRNIQLLSYFDEKNDIKCGICDVCLNQKKKPLEFEKVALKIEAILLKKKSLSAKEIVILHPNYTEKEILTSLLLLVEKNKLQLTKDKKYTLQ